MNDETTSAAREPQRAHTPGPWHIDDEGIPTIDGGLIVRAKSGGRIAETYDGGAVESAPRDGRANAALIAAAPELLAACVAALDAIDQADYDAQEFAQPGDEWAFCQRHNAFPIPRKPVHADDIDAVFGEGTADRLTRAIEEHLAQEWAEGRDSL